MFGDRGNTIMGQFLVKVVLLDVLVNVGLKGKAATVPLKTVRLKVHDNFVLHGSGHCLAKEVVIKGLIGLTAVLGLQVLLRVGPGR